MMQTHALTAQTIVEFHPLHIGEEVQGEYEVGRAETGTFISLPAEGVYLLNLLQSQIPLGKVKELFASRYGQEPDLDDFLEGMLACGFIQRIDEHLVEEESTTEEAGRDQVRGWRLLGNLSPASVAWLRSRPMYLFYIALWVLVPLLLIIRPALFPSPTKALILSSVLANAVLLAVLAWIRVGIHEVAHTLAAKAYGCDSSVMLSHRLYFLAAQTDMTSVRTLPYRQRYGPYLAGMTCDMGFLLICLVAQLFLPSVGLLAALSYLLVLGQFSQFAFFMRTDIYYVFANFFRLGNLMQDTQRWLLAKLARVSKWFPSHDLSAISEREMKVIRYYAIFYLIGVFVALAEFVIFGLPLLLAFLRLALSHLQDGPIHLAFWDGFAFLLLVLANFGLLFFIIWRDHLRRWVA